MIQLALLTNKYFHLSTQLNLFTENTQSWQFSMDLAAVIVELKHNLRSAKPLVGTIQPTIDAGKDISIPSIPKS